jgi:hypothetical protein
MTSAFSGTDWTFVISEIIKSAVGIDHPDGALHRSYWYSRPDCVVSQWCVEWIISLVTLTLFLQESAFCLRCRHAIY